MSSEAIVFIKLNFKVENSLVPNFREMSAKKHYFLYSKSMKL